ncbi:HDOD domain-containing protein [Planctomycetota bacterium]
MAQRIKAEQNNKGQAILSKLLKKAKVPTLPLVAQKLVELCKDEDAAFADFARVIESDVGLASRLLQVTNSAYYGLRNQATTLERAISVLGLKYVKTVSLGFHLATTLSKMGGDGFNMGEFWRQNLLRGVLARQLAGHYCPQRQEEAFLVGLLQDCGIPFLIEALGEKYALLWRESQDSQAALFKLEQEVFEIDHLEAADALTEQWSLPELLAQPIRTHHRRPQRKPSKIEKVQLRQIAYFVGTLSLNNPACLTEEDLALVEFSQDVFGLDQEGLQKILQQSKQEFSNIAQLFKDILGGQVDVTNLLIQVNSLLSDDAINSGYEVFELEKSVSRLHAKCENLTSSMDEYQQEAETDNLTGLSMRGPLDRFLDNACWKVRNQETNLTVIFLDVDDFKDINDNHTHAAGDRLLQLLAGLLQDLFAKWGCVSRYGGDEFVAALVGLNLKQSIKVAQGLIQKIRDSKLMVRSAGGQGEVSFSCSIGMLFCESGAKIGNSTQVLEMADHLMYTVKNRGKDDMHYEVLAADEQKPVMEEKTNDAAKA